MRFDEMGDSMCYDTGFSASCAGKKQQRTINVFNRFALLRIETGKEIHQGNEQGERFQNNIAICDLYA